MSLYTLAWVTYGAVSLLALAAWWRLTRWVRWRAVRELARATAGVILLIPWEIPGAPGHYAPAALVALIEGTLQENGNPLPALIALLLAAAVVNAALLFWRLFQRPSG